MELWQNGGFNVDQITHALKYRAEFIGQVHHLHDLALLASMIPQAETAPERIQWIRTFGKAQYKDCFEAIIF